MARKRVERNISYDDVRKKFYVNLDFGFGTNGKQIKKTQTFSTITEARKALRAHEVKKTAAKSYSLGKPQSPIGYSYACAICYHTPTPNNEYTETVRFHR